MKTPIVKIGEDGTKRWFLNGKLHREDGPAIECADGGKCWYINDKLHREDGPAVECADGGKCWYINDKLHREDGPAIEHANGDKFWLINGVKLNKKEFNKLTNKNLAPVVKVIEIDGVKYELKKID